MIRSREGEFVNLYLLQSIQTLCTGAAPAVRWVTLAGLVKWLVANHGFGDRTITRHTRARNRTNSKKKGRSPILMSGIYKREKRKERKTHTRTHTFKLILKSFQKTQIQYKSLPQFLLLTVCTYVRMYVYMNGVSTHRLSIYLSSTQILLNQSIYLGSSSLGPWSSAYPLAMPLRPCSKTLGASRPIRVSNPWKVLVCRN